MSPWAVVAIVLLGILALILLFSVVGVLAYVLKDRIQSLVNRWSILREGQLADSRNFEQQIQRRLLQNGEQKTALYEQRIEEYKAWLATERHERLIAEQRALEMQRTLEKMEMQAIDIMEGAAEIARLQSERLKVMECIPEEQRATRQALDRLNVHIEALGYILAQIAFPNQRKTFADLVHEIGKDLDDSILQESKNSSV